MSTQQPEALAELRERLRSFEADHDPDGWPAVRMRDITALLDDLDNARSDNRVLRLGYAAARLEVESLKAQLHAAKQINAAQADSVPAVSDLPPLPAPDLRDVGTKPQEIKEFLKGYATEYARTAIAARAPADSVQEDAALWHWLAEYLVGTRTDLDDEIVASETVNDLRKLVKAAIKQGATQ